MPESQRFLCLPCVVKPRAAHLHKYGLDEQWILLTTVFQCESPGESFFFFKHFTPCGLSMDVIHKTKSDNAPSRAVSCISQAPISTACLIPPLPHLLICNLTAPPPLPPYGPNSGSLSSCSRGRQRNNPEGERGWTIMTASLAASSCGSPSMHSC